ncbi:MAG TPA: DegT/DnrJ/EryC1/StrS family aminotransferase [Dongiaceae bacterium]|nr:DegT/DnrJ/EryC1/StrS family aminotransferase [Dongiaceae bacterium]
MKPTGAHPTEIVSQVDSGRADFVPWWKTRIDDADVALLMRSVEEKRFSMGSGTAAFEAELASILGVRHALATTSGSMALMMSMLALGIGPGDEVIVPDRTFIATAHGASLLGARIVLADCKRDDPNVDPAEIERKISARTKAVLVVHLNGHACDMEPILAVAGRFGVPVVEDAAQALFSRKGGRFLGSFGAMGCFSLGMTKIASTGQGGAIVTDDPRLYERLRSLRNHGVRDVITHDYLESGGNFKFNDLLAGIGLGQIRRWREKVEHCNAVYRTYRRGLAGLPGLRVLDVDVDGGECALWTEMVADARDRLVEALAGRGIQTRKFLPCLHSAPHLAGEAQFPNSQRFAATGLVLPSGPDQPIANVERTIEAIKAIAPALRRN